MKWNFRKSKKIFPGFRLNWSKKGPSVNLGVRGANVHIGGKGTHLNLGLPGTGISSRTKLGGTSNTQPQPETFSTSCSVCDTPVDPYAVKFCPGCGGKFAENQSLPPRHLISTAQQYDEQPNNKGLFIFLGIAVGGAVLFAIVGVGLAIYGVTASKPSPAPISRPARY